MENDDVQFSEENLWCTFDSFDTDKSNVLSIGELRQALFRSTGQAFQEDTIEFMTAIFDTNHSNSFNYTEFCALWQFITKWKQCFKSFDKKDCGHINRSQFSDTLKYFGLSLSNSTVETIMQKYSLPDDKDHLQFDSFIQCCVKLTMLTKAFKMYDKHSDGWADVHFNQCLGMIFY